jgi:2-phospho-L-lactate guanylyltransferase
VRTLAILPVKRFDAAKQRLGAGLEADSRRVLAEAMVGDVLDALGRVAGLDGVIVVTGEARAAELARAAGARVLDDADDAGQSAATLRGIAAALADGCERVLLVPGDCPALDPAEVDALLDRRAEHPPAVAIVPDRHGTGTNALLLSPPDVLEPGFGPGSRDRHVERAVAAGADPFVEELRSLALDVDTPDDLAALRRALAGRVGRAPRTAATLERLLRDAAPAA